LNILNDYFFNEILKKTLKKNYYLSAKKKEHFKSNFLDDLSYFEHATRLVFQRNFEKKLEKKLLPFGQKKKAF